LGDVAWYLDQIFGGSDMEPLGPPRRWTVHSNWKAAADQFVGDTYHTASLHRSMFELGFVQADTSDYRTINMGNVKVSFPEGHGIIGFNPMSFGAMAVAKEELDESRFHSFEGMTFSALLYPACWTGGNSLTAPDGSPVLTGQVAGMAPKGPGAFEFWTLPLVDRSAPEGLREFMRRTGPMMFGMGADDFEGWPSMQRAATGVMGQRQRMRYNALLGENRPGEWPGPGTVHAGFPKDDNQWKFWLRWVELMGAPAAG
jgi:hypothetical protein